MKRISNIAAAALTAMFLMAGCTQSEIAAPEVDNGRRVPILGIPDGAVKGEVLVKFAPEVSEMLDKAGITKSGDSETVLTRSGIPSFDEVMDIVGGYEIERVFPIDARNEERTRDNGLHLWYTVRFDASQDVREVAEKLSSIGELSTIQYSSELKRTPYKAVGADPAAIFSNGIAPQPSDGGFDDPGLERQWHYINKGYFDVNGNGVKDDGDEVLIGADGKSTMIAGSDVNVKEAWKKCTGDPSVIVAVMDEGVMWSHPDLSANMWVNDGEEWLGTEDADNNGYVGDRYGYNFVHDNGIITWNSQGDTGHGSHVAGTIAAVNNNGEGVCGIAGGDAKNGQKGVRIMSLQTFAGDKGANIQNEVRAIKYAADNGAVILQCSWGQISALADPLYYPQLGPRDDEAYEASALIEVEAFDYFIHNAGSKDGVIDGGIVVFAAGNEFAAMPAYPGAYKDYVCVSAIAADYSPTTYTNYGAQVDICTPGGDTDHHMNQLGSIYSTMPPEFSDQKGYGYMDGTSMACPHMSGVAALGLSYAAQQHRHFNSREYRELLLKAVQPIDDKFFETGNDGNPTDRTRYKIFYKNWGLAGAIAKEKMPLSQFKGKVGSGMADAARLLALIDGGEYGSDMVLTNVSVKAGEVTSIQVNRCFRDGDKAGAKFSAESYSPEVATVAIEGTVLKVTGVSKGTARIKVTCNSETQEAYVTVRNNSNDNGII